MCIHKELKPSGLKPHLVVFTGAGISAESGMPMYRDINGLWNQPELAELMSVGGYYEKPEKVLEILNVMRLSCFNAVPNKAHLALAKLEELFKVSIITQNVDDLHERAGNTHILHLHGKLTEVTSSKNRCNARCICEFPLDIPIKIGDKAKDGSQLRPNVILFGEYLSEFSHAVEIVKTADVFLAIGTSLTVFPASRLINYVPADIPRFMINPGVTVPEDVQDFILINEKATIGLETVKALIQ